MENPGNNGGGGSGTKSRMGRQKIEIKRIASEEARQVCFSKRRNGLIKKAGELCILCGAEIAIIVFSPAGKAFSYGDPSVDAILHRFLHSSSPDSSSSGPPAPPDPHRAMVVEELNHQHDDLVRRIEEEKKRREVLHREHQRYERSRVWDADVTDMNPGEMAEFAGALEEMRSALAKRAEELMMGMAYNNVVPQNTILTHDHHYRQLAPSLPSSSSLPFLPNSSYHTNNSFSQMPLFTNNNHNFLGSSLQQGAVFNGGGGGSSSSIGYDFLNNHGGSFNPLDFSKYGL